MTKIIHVLLSGGVGSRLWPLSRRSMPKQYLEIFSDRSLFELAIKRNRAYSQGVIIVGNEENNPLSEKVLEKLRIEGFQNIREAVGRNTAPAIAFAALSTNPEDILLVTPADHIIENEKKYEEAILEAIEMAKKDFLVTFGIIPNKPETGYGYIQYRGSSVSSFHEKPNKQTAERFLKSGGFLWNSGMFCFKAGVFLEELMKNQPEVFTKCAQAWNKSRKGVLDFSSSLGIPAISIDHAVMEKSKKIKVVKADFTWSDMGSFEAIYDYLKAKGYLVDSNNNMHIGDQKPTYFVGVNNCILISTKDANLVVERKSSQEVRAVYQYLKENRPELI